MKYLVCYFGVMLLVLLSSIPGNAYAQEASQVTPLWRAHAHNDYEQERPLLEALSRGIGSIEVDIHLVDGALLVAHDLEDVDSELTLEHMYLDPLKEQIQVNGGSVYGLPHSIVLLIDVKSEAVSTYKVLREVLAGYPNMFTEFNDGVAIPGPVTAIISGNRDRETMLEETVRFAAYDGRLEDLGLNPPLPTAFMPLVSSNWMQVARWFGNGEMPAEAREKLAEIVAQAHSEGRKIRFWATSDNPAVWQVLYDAGVDFLNADDLARVQEFLLEKQDSNEPYPHALPSVELPAELDRVLRDYETHWQNRDAEALAALFTEDGFILRPGRPAVRGRVAIAEAYRNSGGPLLLRAKDFAVEDAVAYIIGGYRAIADGPDAGKFILALKRGDDGRWHIHADMDNGNQ
ncbi:MAG: DUF4440 domain-containing protein [Bacteroidota bacterium]